MKKIIIICLTVISCFCISCSYQERDMKEKNSEFEDKKSDNNAEGSSDGATESEEDFDVEEFLLQQDTSVSYNYCADAKELVDKSEYIVSGKIADKKEIKPNDDSKEKFLYNLEIADVYKGQFEKKTLDFTISSLESGMAVKENGLQAELAVGKNFLLLLNKEGNEYIVSTIAQSIYLVSKDEIKTDNERMITLDMIMDYLADEDEPN